MMTKTATGLQDVLYNFRSASGDRHRQLLLREPVRSVMDFGCRLGDQGLLHFAAAVANDSIPWGDPFENLYHMS